MKRPLFEAEKNFITCAILMIIVGIGMIAMNKTNMGIICIVVGVTFFATAVHMYMTNDNRPPEKEKKVKKADKEDKETKSE